MALKKEYLKFQQQHLNDIVENKFNITNKNMIKIINDIWQDNMLNIHQIQIMILKL